VPKRVTNLYDFEKGILCRAIFVFYEEGEFAICKKSYLHRDKIKYSGSVSSMYQLLKNTSLRYRNTNYDKTLLLERGDIVPLE
jgi:hypothetical protein